jgi:small ligand-binding sensory domain FIST
MVQLSGAVAAVPALVGAIGNSLLCGQVEVQREAAFALQNIYR